MKPTTLFVLLFTISSVLAAERLQVVGYSTNFGLIIDGKTNYAKHVYKLSNGKRRVPNFILDLDGSLTESEEIW